MPREFEVRKEVALTATPEEVWAAIATGPGLASWFMAMDISAEQDGVVAWDPPARLAIRTPEAPDGSTQAFEYLVEARDGAATVLRFVHSGTLGNDWSDEFEGMTERGWAMYLHTLAEYLRHFRGRTATYVIAEAPATSAAPAAWPVLLSRLGVPLDVEAGAPVHLDLDAVGRIDGVVDYRDTMFLGIRTADALYRFHGRSALGMTIAAGHHDFTPGVDADLAGAAWRRWLAEALS